MIDMVVLQSINEGIKVYGLPVIIKQYERVKEQLDAALEEDQLFEQHRRDFWQKQLDDVNEILIYLEERSWT